MITPDNEVTRLEKRQRGLQRVTSAINDLNIYGIYPQNFPKYRFYGNNIKTMIDVANTWEDGEMKDMDQTTDLRNMTHNEMLGGYDHFRPQAWHFLTELTSDPEAILFLQYSDRNKYIKVHNMTKEGLLDLDTSTY